MSRETRSAAVKPSAELPVSGVTMIKVMASHRTNKKAEILTKDQQSHRPPPFLCFDSKRMLELLAPI
jgi:hypothetical protein